VGRKARENQVARRSAEKERSRDIDMNDLADGTGVGSLAKLEKK
jgi:hypothetical protein